MPSGIFTRSEEHKRNIAEALRGKKKSAEHCAALSASKKGVRHTPEWKEAIRQKMLAKPPNLGKPMSQEAKNKLSAANRGRAPKLRRYGITDAEYKAQIDGGNKWCYSGKHFVSVNEFTDKRRTLCDACKSSHYRQSDLKRKYGVTPEWFDATFAAQGMACGICKRPRNGDENNFVVDHSHETNEVRGILCVPCNFLIERLDKTPEWIHRAVAYLDHFHISPS